MKDHTGKIDEAFGKRVKMAFHAAGSVLKVPVPPQRGFNGANPKMYQDRPPARTGFVNNKKIQPTRAQQKMKTGGR